MVPFILLNVGFGAPVSYKSTECAFEMLHSGGFWWIRDSPWLGMSGELGLIFSVSCYTFFNQRIALKILTKE